MKKKHLTVALFIALASSFTFSSCIGSFALTNKVMEWNNQVSSKFENAVIFTAFWIVPVYEITAIADAIVINTIEFWSGTNPIEANTQIIDGKDAKYQIDRHQYGYTITNLADNSVIKFHFTQESNSWSIEANGHTYPLMQFVDDNHIKVIAPNNTFEIIELSQQGVLAYQDIIYSGVTTASIN